MAAAMAQNSSGGLTRDHVVWAYRLLLDRDPESEDVIGPKLAGSRTTAELRHHLITSTEFREKNPDFAHTNDSTVVIKEIAPGVRLFLDLSDHAISLNILRGHYEEEEIGFVRTILKPGDSAVDVGGHIGFFTMHMAAAVGPEGRVYAFEPLETLNSGGAYLLRDGGTPLAGNQRREVPLVSLDTLELRRPIRFIKMDVEGAEPQVLRGAARILADDRPVILSELHPTQLERASGVTADQFLAQIEAFGYRAHRIERGVIGARIDHAPAEALVSVVLVPR